MKSSAFKKYENKEIGISFTCDSGWVEEKDKQIKYKTEGFDVFFHKATSGFGINKLSFDMCNFISRWPLDKAILCAINQNEIIIDDVKTNKYTIGGENTASVITKVIDNNEILILEYILVDHKDQYYLLAFTEISSKRFNVNDNQKNVKNIINDFKFLN